MEKIQDKAQNQPAGSSEKTSQHTADLSGGIGELMQAVSSDRQNQQVETPANSGNYHRIVTGIYETLDVMCTFLDAMGEAICLFDSAGENILYHNQSMRRFLAVHGLPEDGRSLLTRLLFAGSNDDHSEQLADILRNFSTAPYNCTINLTSAAEGTPKIFAISLQQRQNKGELPHIENAGARTRNYVMVTITDITGIIQTKIDAEQASRSRNEFLSLISHEMHTPMNAIIGMTYIATKSRDMHKIRYCLDRIEKAAKDLQSVISQILDMSKIETNRIRLYDREFNLEKMLTDITYTTNYAAEEKKQNFVINIHRNVPATVVGDSLRLKQVLNYMLTNAINFTGTNGAIMLNIEKIEEDTDLITLRFEVIDNGIGISQEQMRQLFIPYEHRDSSTSRKQSSAGLGLVVSKHLIELMGGWIHIESIPGRGTKITFTIRVKKGQEKTITTLNPSIRKDHIRILAVDDSPEIRHYLAEIMDVLELTCDIAADGDEALDLVAQNSDHPYDISFIDWQMPGMNGIELVRRIREQAPDCTFVIMVSSSRWSDIESDASKAGVGHYLPKPLLTSPLVNCINEILVENFYAHRENWYLKGDNLLYNMQKNTILLAEDAEINKKILLTILEPTGIAIDFADNGADAIAMFRSQPQRYDLILMDIHMPEMDGYTATKKIRALDLPKAKSIPIIALTANAFNEDIRRCIDAGMDDHVAKPIDPSTLLNKLTHYLPGPRIANISDEAAELALSGDYSAYLPIIDVPDGLSRLMNNKKLYLMSLKMFSDNNITAELVKNIQEEDLAKISQTANALKNATGNLGLSNLLKIATIIENQSRAKTNSLPLLEALQETAKLTEKTIRNLLESEVL